MANQQLLDYIKRQLDLGASKEEIKVALLGSGWQESDIEKAFSLLDGGAPEPPQEAPVLGEVGTSSFPGATAIFGQAWSIYKKRIGTLLAVMLIPMLVMITLDVVFVTMGVFGSGLLFISKFNALVIGLLIILGILLFAVALTSQAWGQAALIYAVKEAKKESAWWRRIAGAGVKYFLIGGFPP